MSLEDDLTRNRKIFELLTGSQDSAEADSAEAPSAKVSAPEVYTAEAPFVERQRPLSQPIAEAANNSAPLKAFEQVTQKIETFSLEYGKTASRETGMALNFSPPDSIDFPELSQIATASPADPLDILYRQLESEARRASQLSREEEF